MYFVCTLLHSILSLSHHVFRLYPLTLYTLFITSCISFVPSYTLHSLYHIMYFVCTLLHSTLSLSHHVFRLYPLTLYTLFITSCISFVSSYTLHSLYHIMYFVCTLLHSILSLSHHVFRLYSLNKYQNLSTCSKSVNKPSTGCVGSACLKLSTSLQQQP